MSFHTCWEVRPTGGQPGMPLADLLARLADAFPVHEFDHEGARQGALRRLAALQSMTMPTASGETIPLPVPEEIVASYRDAYPVNVVLADSPGAEEAVRGMAAFATAEGREGCLMTYSLEVGPARRLSLDEVQAEAQAVASAFKRWVEAFS